MRRDTTNKARSNAPIAPFNLSSNRLVSPSHFFACIRSRFLRRTRPSIAKSDPLPRTNTKIAHGIGTRGPNRGSRNPQPTIGAKSKVNEDNLTKRALFDTDWYSSAVTSTSMPPFEHETIDECLEWLRNQSKEVVDSIYEHFKTNTNRDETKESTYDRFAHNIWYRPTDRTVRWKMGLRA